MSLRELMAGDRNIRLIIHPSEPAQLVLRKGGVMRIVALQDLNWVEASAHRCIFHFNNSSFTIRESFSAIEQLLDSQMFVKVNRSLLINVERVREITPWMRGQSKVTMRDGSHVICRKADKLLDVIASRGL